MSDDELLEWWERVREGKEDVLSAVYDGRRYVYCPVGEQSRRLAQFRKTRCESRRESDDGLEATRLDPDSSCEVLEELNGDQYLREKARRRAVNARIDAKQRSWREVPTEVVVHEGREHKGYALKWTAKRARISESYFRLLVDRAQLPRASWRGARGAWVYPAYVADAIVKALAKRNGRVSMYDWELPWEICEILGPKRHAELVFRPRVL